MKTLKQYVAIIATLITIAGFTSTAYAQTTVTQTTLSAAVTATARAVSVASATDITVGVTLFVDTEAMLVTAVSGTRISVTRAQAGTPSVAHSSGAIVYAGRSSQTTGTGPFWFRDPIIGSGCTYSSETYSLRINVNNARIWQCTGGQWMNVIDAFEFVPATACQSAVSGNATGTNGYTVQGTTSAIGVIQAQTDTTSTNTHYYTCVIPTATRTAVTKATYVVDVLFFYGVQTTALGTQVATLASGTMNSVAVFRYADLPAAAASETAAGTNGYTRADSGTLTITPPVASFNVATTTAGRFYSAKFTPATPIAMATDGRLLTFTASFLNTATSATVTNTPGFIVHYRTLNAGQ